MVRSIWRMAVGIALTVGSIGSAAADVVTDWNSVLIAAVKTDTALATTQMPGPGWASRNMAMTMAAVCDAINNASPTQSYTNWAYTGPLVATASGTAAAAQAAHDVLSNLYPSQKAKFDTALATSLTGISGTALTTGTALGATVATQVLAKRTNDGSAVSVNYTVNNTIGHWQPDPLNPNQSAWGPNWGTVTPFALTSGQKTSIVAAIPPPPALNSQAFATAYNQVKDIGALNSLTRTIDQTAIGIYWGYDVGGLGPPPVLYNQITKVIADQQHNTVAQNARLFALTNLAMADAGMVSWAGKFEYDFWRPITAIRRGDEIGSALISGDPNWKPLGAPDGANGFTPPFPAYASGHATFGGALFTTIKNFYGTDDIPFTFTSDELPSQPRSFSTLTQASLENAESRIYLGIHWQFDADYGISSGDAVGDAIFGSTIVPLPEPSTFVLAGLGGFGLFAAARRRRQAAR